MNNQIEVIDMQGATVGKYALTNNNIDLQHLKTGFYVLKFPDDDGIMQYLKHQIIH